MATINGTSGDDNLVGTPDSDNIDGRGGADIMRGMTGADIYYVDDAGDQIVEQPGGGLDTALVSVDYTLPDNVEIVRAYANDPNILNQIPSFDLTLTGNSAPNHLYGGNGSDVLDGAGGGDRMVGGHGDDTYYIDHAGDRAFEAEGGGVDTIYTSVSMSLLTGVHRMPANVEIVRGLGSDDIDFVTNTQQNTIFGNSGNNNFIDDVSPWTVGLHKLYGGAGDDTYHISMGVTLVFENADEGIDTIYSDYRSNDTQRLPDNVENLVFGQSGSGNCVIIGNDLDNSLIAGNSTDTIDGGAGADHMEGKTGADTYYVDNASDEVVELAGEGLDTMYTSISPADLSATHGIPDSIEIVRASGSADLHFELPKRPFIAYGNAGDNTFTDTDTLWRTGNHKIHGGAGDDAYHVSVGMTTIFENAGEGIDTIYSDIRSTDYQVLPDNVENLVFGQSLDGNCLLFGNELDNSLIAGGSIDTLDGRAGADHMEGKAGGDTYYVDNAGDEVVELAGEGLDSVYSSLDYILPDNVEAGVLTGSAQTLTGNSGSNHLTGNAEDNILDGDGGTDRYTGRGGADTFRFSGAFGGDVVTDFVSGTDIIDFSASDNIHEFSDITQTFYDDDILIRDGFHESVWVLNQSAFLDQSDFFFGIV